jgi:hypothetical protein
LPSGIVKQLDYDSRELSILRKWKYGERWKDIPIKRGSKVELDMRRFKNVKLLRDLAPFALPPLKKIVINYLSKAEREVKHFLVHSLGQQIDLSLNQGGDLLDGKEWVEAIVKALPRVKKYVYLWEFSFSKEQVEAIVDNSLHLESLDINRCKLRKWCDLRCNTSSLTIYWISQIKIL